MTLRNDIELANTVEKLRELEARYDELKREADEDEDDHVRELTMRSFMRLIKQLKEEITLYRIHQTAGRER